MNDWPTQNQDMEIATSIVSKYLEQNEGEPLGFLELIVYRNREAEKNRVELKMPEWIVELHSHFRDQYGYEHGHAVTSKVLTKFLLRDEVVH